ncbi:MAG: Beta-lactamase class [Myxococcaceae bacterium]|nr:Beta-lactamase class [Myxococcaceae bacterium]
MKSTHEVHAQELDALLLLGLRKQVFPGAVCAVGRLVSAPGGPPAENQHGTVLHAPESFLSARFTGRAGRLAPHEAEVALGTPYDLASLTKPLVAIAALRLAQRGLLDLHAPVCLHLPELEATHGGDSSLSSLLSHRAGLAAWGSLYREFDAPPGSAAMKRFMLREAATRVAEGLPPGQSLYSDFGYLLAGEVLARAAGAPLNEVLSREVTGPLGLADQIYYAAALEPEARARLVASAAPTERCSVRGRVLRGEVHDENCYAFGGVAGHAGLFGTASAVLSFGLSVLAALEGRSLWLDQALLRWALKPRGAGHVVGWDTKSAEGSSAGDQFSEQSFGHLGFTGTSIWCDPTRRLCAVLLSNRVHPTRDNIAIRAFRPRFHDAMAELAFKKTA